MYRKIKFPHNDGVEMWATIQDMQKYYKFVKRFDAWKVDVYAKNGITSDYRLIGYFELTEMINDENTFIAVSKIWLERELGHNNFILHNNGINRWTVVHYKECIYKFIKRAEPSTFNIKVYKKMDVGENYKKLSEFTIIKEVRDNEEFFGECETWLSINHKACLNK